MDAPHPLLVLGTPTGADREKATGGGGRFHGPSAERQAERLASRFAALQAVLDRGTTTMRGELAGVAPEHAVVLEIRDSVEDFQKAVEATDDVEWLAELDLGRVPKDDEFWIVDTKKDEAKDTIRKKLFLVMLDQAGIRQLLGLWNQWNTKPSERLPHRLGKWKEVFKRLYDVRTWGPQDRLEETGVLEAWREDLALGGDSIRFEVELWWRNSTPSRDAALARVQALVEQAGGEVVGRPTTIAEIQYCALLASLPRGQVEEVLRAADNIDLAMCDHVMFFRPRGHADLSILEVDEGVPTVPTSPPPASDPRVALLDGLPIEKHALLDGWIRVDDPDGWATAYPAAGRRHGTAMASLIVHGDLQQPATSLPSQIYVRPVLKWDPDSEREEIPDDRLAVDLLHVAVRRLFEGARPEAPSVRVINLSLGDRNRPFDSASVSPWARLLDWLSLKYGVLFVVSAGNHPTRLDLGGANAADLPGDRESTRAAALSAWTKDRRLRRILSPGEAINVLTVAALNDDEGEEDPSLGSTIVEPLGKSRVPSTIGALGLGYKRAIKPDLALPGGRTPYRRSFGGSVTELEVANGSLIPLGIQVASPGLSGGNDARAFARGTSNAAALATRQAAQVLHRLEDLREAGPDDFPDREFDALLTKALLIHACSWREIDPAWLDFIKETEDPRRRLDEIARAVGFGAPRLERVLGCHDQRATAFAAGHLSGDEGFMYALPLPHALSGSQVRWRLTCTLCWWSPINPASQKYRAAALWTSVDPTNKHKFDFSSEGPNRQTAKRGTVEHAIFETDGAAVFRRASELEIKVSCRGDALADPEDVPFALAVSLETARGTNIPIYAEIRDRIRPRVRPRPR